MVAVALVLFIIVALMLIVRMTRNAARDVVGYATGGGLVGRLILFGVVVWIAIEAGVFRN